MINLLSLTLKNFLSHKDTTIDLTVYDGLTLIEGKTQDGHYSSNGSGKSTILEGVYYALTGKTLRGLTGDSVVNNKFGKDLEVTLEFIVNGTSYMIHRYRKHTTQSNSLVLVKEGEDVSLRLPTETQKVIDALVDMPGDVLSGVMIMGEGLSSRFTTLSDPDKKALLESTIRLSHDISLLRDKVKTRIREVKEQIQFKDGQLSAHLKLIEEYRRELETDISASQERLSGLSVSITGMEARLSEISKELSTNSTKLNSLSQAINNIDQENRLLVTARHSREEYQSQLSTATSDLPTCPVCHKSLDDPTEVVALYTEKLSEVNETISLLETKISQLPDRGLMVSKYNEISTSSTLLSAEQTQLTSSLSSSRSEHLALTDVLSRYSQLETNIKSLQSEDAILTSDIKELNAKLETLTYLEKQIFSPTGVIVDILSGVVSYIDTRLQVYTKMLLDKVFHLTFTKGKISIDSSTPYQSLSNGEKRRLDISIQFALHDYIYTHCGIGFDTLFIDEVLDTLDVIGVTNIMEVLSLKRQYCSLRRIFIVTHNDELKSYFDSSLSVSKDTDGITYLV